MHQDVTNDLPIKRSHCRHLLTRVPIQNLVHHFLRIAHLRAEGFSHILWPAAVLPMAIGTNGIEISRALFLIATLR